MASKKVSLNVLCSQAKKLRLGNKGGLEEEPRLVFSVLSVRECQRFLGIIHLRNNFTEFCYGTVLLAFLPAKIMMYLFFLF